METTAKTKQHRTKLYLYFTDNNSGDNELREFSDKIEIDEFLEMNRVTPVAIIRGSLKKFKNRVVFA